MSSSYNQLEEAERLLASSRDKVDPIALAAARSVAITEALPVYYDEIKDLIDKAVAEKKRKAIISLEMNGIGANVHLLDGDTFVANEFSRIFCEESGLSPEEVALVFCDPGQTIDDEGQSVTTISIVVSFRVPLQPLG